MNRSLLLSLLFATAVGGRENPFFTADPSAVSSVTSNVVENKPPLGAVSFTLSDQARVLKEISYTVQNVDGSFETRKVRIDKAIDWHKSVLVSQANRGSGEEAILPAGGSSADFGLFKIETQGKRLSITTSAPVVRHFALTGPNRIVIDFEDARRYPLSEKPLNAAPYSSASVGNHGKFIRTTILLDGRYGYTFKQSGNVISIVCR